MTDRILTVKINITTLHLRSSKIETHLFNN